jgi:phosphopantothenoylcysteine decarboxylase/phosphopantothenate--cysteine ligase
MIVANDVSDAAIGFNSDHNAATVIWKGGEMSLDKATKDVIARRVLELVARRAGDIDQASMP